MINHRIITSPFAGIIAAILLVSTASSAKAFRVFSGQDVKQNPSNLTPRTRLPSTPNANAVSSNFLSNLIDPSTENFEEFAPGIFPSFFLDFGNAGTGTFEGRGTLYNLPSGVIDDSFYPVSGNQFLRIGSRVGSDYNATFNTITFSNPVGAIGFYYTGLRNVLNSTLLELTLTNGTRREFRIPDVSVSGNETSVFYYGIIAQDQSEQFTQVRLISDRSRSSSLGLDNLTVASFDQIKEPTPVLEPLTVEDSSDMGDKNPGF